MQGHKSFGNRLTVVWELAQMLVQQRSFQATGGLQGVPLAQHPNRRRFLLPNAKWGMSDAQARGYINDAPDYVILCHGVPIGWRATRDGVWRFPVRKQETPMMEKYRLMMEAVAQLAVAAGEMKDSA